MYWIGTAGWSVSSDTKREGSHLSHYSRTFSCVEVNSSFYRAHRPGTWARWAAETPPEFCFSVKAPKTVTHEKKLHDVTPLLRDFFEQIEPLQSKRGPVLFQLPPKLAFDLPLAEDFFGAVRELYKGDVVLEPRHASWFAPAVGALLAKHTIGRVAADPPQGGPAAAEPSGDTAVRYYRLHGSPRVYYSPYEEEFLRQLAAKIASDENTWVIFDNTALGHAYSNALRLRELIAERGLSS